MNRSPRTCFLVCLIGLAASVLLIGAVLTLRQHLSRRETAQSYTPLTGDAQWGGDWKLSEQGADPSQAGSLAGTDRVTIPFTGTQLALLVRRGDYRAHLWVSVDGEPANRLPRTERGAYLVLSSPDYEPQVTTIPVAGDLDDGAHFAEVVADRGWNQWPLVGWRVQRGPDTRQHDNTVKALAGIAVAFLVGAIGCGARWARETSIARNETRISSPPSASPNLRFPFSLLRSPISLGIAAAVFYVSPWAALTWASGVVLAAAIIMRPNLGLALIAFSAPFYLHPRTVLHKSFSMAEIATLLCMVSWGIRQIRTPIRGSVASCLQDVSLMDLAVLLLVLCAAVSTLFADHRHVALRELRVVILEPAAFYLMLRTSRLDETDVRRIVGAFVGGGMTVALIGLSQYALDINVITAEQGFRRLRSVYGSPNNAALYLGRTLPVLVALTAFGTGNRQRLASGILAAPVALAVLLSFSRGAILVGIPVSLVALAAFARKQWRWILVALLASAAVVIIPLLSTPRFAGLLDPTTGTLFFRLQLWRSSWKMFLDHPWLGVGPDNFLYQYRGRYILPTAWQEPHLSHAHNVLLTYATRLGLLGLAAGALLQVLFWRRAHTLASRARHNHRALTLGLIGSMAYTLAHGMIDASFFFVDLAFAFLLVLGLVEWLLRRNIRGQKA